MQSLDLGTPQEEYMLKTKQGIRRKFRWELRS